MVGDTASFIEADLDGGSPACSDRGRVTRPDDRNRKVPGHAISPIERPRLSEHLAAQSDPEAPDRRGERD